MIIAISGTPGTGKTEVAKKLAEKIGFEYISLNSVAEENNFYIGYDEKRKCKIVDVDAISKEIENRRLENLVIESHYAHDVFSDILIILKCELKELKKRMQKKGWPEKKIEENMEAEIMEVCRTEAHETEKNFFVVDSSGDVEKTVSHIRRLIRRH